MEVMRINFKLFYLIYFYFFGMHLVNHKLLSYNKNCQQTQRIGNSFSSDRYHYERRGNMKTKSKYRAVVFFLCMFLLCMFFAGCGGSDRALSLSVPVGENMLSGAETASESDGGRQDMSDSKYAQETVAQSMIYIHVCGAVMKEGVIMLPEGSRGQDALDAAGGFAENAARDAVNLAETLTDGTKLYFPTTEETAGGMWTAEEKSGLVNINTAGVEVLCTLPGIGESKAKSIVAYREANGSFGNIEDIMKVSGIKDNAFNKIKDLITVK